MAPLENRLSLTKLLLPNKSPTLFLAIYGIAVALVALSVGDAFVVGQSFQVRASDARARLARRDLNCITRAQHNQHKRLWPIKLLKAVVTSFVTAGFIPLLGILAIPLSCEDFDGYHASNGATACHSTPHITLICVSLVTLAAFIPLCLLTASVYFDSNPNSRHPLAKPSGRIDLFDVTVRAVAVFAMIAFKLSAPELAAVILCVAYGSIAFYVSVSMPYFKMGVTKLVSSAPQAVLASRLPRAF